MRGAGVYKAYMNRKHLLAVLVGILVVGGAAFYGGMTYAKGQTPKLPQGFEGQVGQFMGQMGAGAQGTRTGGGFSSGEIISSDANSITIKLQNGSTQIVLMGTSTEVLKSSESSLSDLSAGTSVVVTGSTNSDGSLTAQSIQVRPVGLPGAR